MKNFYKLFFLIIILILFANLAKADKNIYDAGVVELEFPKAWGYPSGHVPILEIPQYQFVVKICNYTTTDSLRTVKVKWALLDGDVQSNYGFSWNEKDVDFSQQPASPFMKAIIPVDYYRDVDLDNVDQVDDDAVKTLFVTTDKPNGEDDINNSNDTLRFVIRKIHRDPGLNQIYAPTALSSDAENDTIRIEIFNYGNSTLESVDVKWKVTDKNGNGGSDQTTTLTIPNGLDPGMLLDTVLSTYSFHTASDDKLISAQITGSSINDPKSIADGNDFNDGNNYSWQYVTTAQTGSYSSIDAQAFTIDNPKPDDHDGKQEIVVTVKNNGPQPLKSCQLRWIVQDFDQEYLVNPNDWNLASFYSTESAIYKMGSWNTTNFVFNNPIDSGAWVQLSLDKYDFGSGTKTVTIVPWHPNGQVGSGAKDTARLFLGDYMIGVYSVGDSYRHEHSHFKTINDAMDKLNSMGMPAYVNVDQDNSDPTQNKYLPAGFPSGVQFYIRPGVYKENVKISGLFPNGSNGNTVLFQAYSGDSTSYIIEPKSDDATINFDGAQHIKFWGFTVFAPKNGHAILFNNKAKNINYGASLLIGNTDKTGNDEALVYADGKVDSTDISSTSFIGGSYGFFWNGSSDDKSSGVTLAQSNFQSQNNVAVSFNNCISPAALNNIVYNNRMEVVGSKDVVFINNRVSVNDYSDKMTGVGYSSPPFSAMGFINCENKMVINGGNICVNVDNFNGIHLKDCRWDSTNNSVINMVSVQSQKYPIWLDNAQNVYVVNTSANLSAGMSENSAGLLIDNGSTGTQIINSVIASTGGGMSVVLDSKDLLQSSANNDFYTEGYSIFARVKSDNKFLDLNNWKAYFQFNSDFYTKSDNPRFYDPPCDLIAEGVSEGYQSGAGINRDAYPEMFYPKSNVSLYSKPKVNLQWRNYLNVYGYWLQVRKNSNFQTVKNPLPDVLSADDTLLLDLPGISSYARDTTQSYTLFALEPNTTYYWRLRVYGQQQRSDWGTPESFNTGDIVGISDDKINNVDEMEVFPNPAIENPLIVLKAKAPGNYTIVVYNSLGKAVDDLQTKYFNSGVNKFYLKEIMSANLASGAYYIVATGAGGTFKAGFIKE